MFIKPILNWQTVRIELQLWLITKLVSQALWWIMLIPVGNGFNEMCGLS